MLLIETKNIHIFRVQYTHIIYGKFSFSYLISLNLLFQPRSIISVPKHVARPEVYIKEISVKAAIMKKER